MMLWTWFVSTRIGRWLVGLGAVVAALVAALGIGWLKGRKSQANADKANDAQGLAEAAQQAVAAANKSAAAVEATDAQVSKMPDAGTQRVGDAAPGTAAGWLRANADRAQAGH